MCKRRCLCSKTKGNQIDAPAHSSDQQFAQLVFQRLSVRLFSAAAKRGKHLRTCSRSLSFSCSLNSSYFASICLCHRTTRSAGISSEPSGRGTHLLCRYCCQCDQRSCSIAASGSSNSWSRFLISCWSTDTRLRSDGPRPACDNALPTPSVRMTCSALPRATCGEHQPGAIG